MTLPPRLRAFALSLAVVIVATYLALLVAEIGFWWRSLPMSRVVLERGMYLPDPVLGVTLKPGYDAPFDDGHARGTISINSLGNRDDEPRATGARRILLVGDSFTFGALLDQSQTIDKWIERQRPGLDAYNLGVSGYDLPNQLDALRRSSLPARHVVYLFFGNDLRHPLDQTVLDGYRISPLRGADGRRLPDAQQLAVIHGLEKSYSRWRFPPWRSILLPEIRALTGRAINRIGSGHAEPSDGYSPAERAQLVARGVTYTLEMQALARQRGMSFQVAIIPAVEEVAAGAHTKAVAQYIERLRRSATSTVDLLPGLDTGAYWPHNAHFNPTGARIAGKMIVAGLPKSLTGP